MLSTVGVDLGVNQGTEQAIRDALPGVEEIDRTGVNAWEDPDFRAAIEDSGRRKVVIAGLWSEVCLTFPTLDMLREGYEVYPVADAVGGISPVSHERAFDRMIAAGAQPINAISFGAELMRNWAREDSDNLREVMNWYFPKARDLARGSPHWRSSTSTGCTFLAPAQENQRASVRRDLRRPGLERSVGCTRQQPTLHSQRRASSRLCCAR